MSSFLGHIGPLVNNYLFAVELTLSLLYAISNVPHKRPRFLLSLCFVSAFGLFLWHGGETMTAMWPTTDRGFILQPYALRPTQAWLPNTMLVRPRAVALNPADGKLFQNLARLPFLRWFIPHSVSQDYAGVVLDSNCPQDFKPGDEVFGATIFNSMSEQVIAPCINAMKKPPSVSFEKAAAAPIALFTGLRSFERFDAKTDANVLVIGAAGGCGSFGVTLAKAKGARKVYCIASRKKFDYLASIGCDESIDYRAPDFPQTLHSKLANQIDFVYDTVTSAEDFDYYELAHATLRREARMDPLLKKYVAINGQASDWIKKLIVGPLSGKDVQRDGFELVVMGARKIPKEDQELVFQHASTLFGPVKILEHSNPFQKEMELVLKSSFHDLLKGRNVTGKIVFKMEKAQQPCCPYHN